MENLIEKVKREMKYWWISPIIGVLAIILGAWCIVTPWATILSLSIIFGATFLVTGLFAIIFAVSNKDSLSGWGWTLMSGIIDIIFGIIILSLPIEVITVVLAYFVGFYVMFQSIWGIGTATELYSKKVNGWGWLLALAILGLILSIIFILSPVFTNGVIVYLVSLSFFVYGFFRIYYGFKLKSIKNEIEKEEK